MTLPEALPFVFMLRSIVVGYRSKLGQVVWYVKMIIWYVFLHSIVILPNTLRCVISTTHTHTDLSSPALHTHTNLSVGLPQVCGLTWRFRTAAPSWWPWRPRWTWSDWGRTAIVCASETSAKMGKGKERSSLNTTLTGVWPTLIMIINVHYRFTV